MSYSCCSCHIKLVPVNLDETNLDSSQSILEHLLQVDESSGDTIPSIPAAFRRVSDLSKAYMVSWPSSRHLA